MPRFVSLSSFLTASWLLSTITSPPTRGGLGGSGGPRPPPWSRACRATASRARPEQDRRRQSDSASSYSGRRHRGRSRPRRRRLRRRLRRRCRRGGGRLDLIRVVEAPAAAGRPPAPPLHEAEGRGGGGSDGASSACGAGVASGAGSELGGWGPRPYSPGSRRGTPPPQRRRTRGRTAGWGGAVGSAWRLTRLLGWRRKRRGSSAWGRGLLPLDGV